MREIRLMFLITSTYTGGAEKILWEIIKRLKDKNFAIKICSLKPKGEYADKIEKMGIEVSSLNIRTFPGFRKLFSLIKEISSFKPDILHCFLYKAIQAGRVTGRLAGVKHILSSPRTNYRTKNVVFLKTDRFLKRFDSSAICESLSTRDFLITHLGYQPDKAITIPNGIDVEEWKFSEELRKKIRKEMEIDDEIKVIGFAGRIDRQKGLEYLLDASLEIIKERKGKVRFLIVGEGNQLDSLKKMADKMGISEFYIFTGFRNDIKATLSAMDIFAFPSLLEGMPNVVLEAMACERPVIGTEIDGTKEIIDNNYTGILIPPANSEIIQKEILRLLDDEDKAAKIGKAARKKMEEKFSIDAMVERYIEFYLSLASRG
ncbi:MAG: glycosyltransferase [bacterium]|nr:glycosyltransferase [bacterium]